MCTIEYDVDENTLSITEGNTISNIRRIEYNVDKIRDLFEKKYKIKYMYNRI